MDISLDYRIAILSHILPPSPSGQAVVLHRLLSNLSADRYILISRENYDDIKHDCVATEKLSAKYYHLKPIFQLPILNRFGLSVLSNVFNIPWGIYRRARQIEEIVQKEKCNLLIACTGDLYDLPAAYLVSKRNSIPLIPYIFDDYAYQWTGFYRFISKRMEPFILKHGKAVIVPNEYMQEEYLERYGITSTVIHNPCPLPNLNELDKAERVFNNQGINIVYTGAIYHANHDALRNLICAIHQLERDDLKLHIFPAQPESVLKQKGISGSKFVYHPHIRSSEVPKVLRQADILFLPLAFDSPIPEVVRTSAPGKIGEYLSAGRPILVHAPKDSFISGFFRENHCGVVVDKNDPQVLSQEIDRLISNREMQIKIGRYARRVAEAQFSVDKMSRKFSELIKSIQRKQWT